jgi:transposase
LDLAKNVFQVHAVDENGERVMNRQIRRKELLQWFARQDHAPGCRVGMEACGGSQHWARRLREMGYDARILHPKFVKAYAQGNKNDGNDAAAICEAVQSKRLQSVPVRDLAQQDILVLHRRRERLMKQRVMLINQTRGLLAEYGMVMAKQVGSLYRELPALLEDAGNGLTAVARHEMHEQWLELGEMDTRLEQLDRQIGQLAHHHEACRRLMTIEGVGPLTATAVVAHVGTGQHFRRGRQFANWLGLVPGEHSSGGKTQLLGIHKRGNRYLRTLFVHGARSTLNVVTEDSAPRLRKIAAQATNRATKNKAIVALANRNARIVYALLRDGVPYQVRR